jgi:hypothetical protein
VSDVKTFPTEPEHWTNVQALLQLFYPQFFDPNNDQYVDPAILLQLATLAEETRPWCLPSGQQDLAQSAFTAYLVSLRNETSSGVTQVPTIGPIQSEKEGDISVTYAASTTNTQSGMSQRPPSDAWDTWNRLYMRCAKGSIITRFGDPCKSPIALTDYITPLAFNVWYPIW